MSAPLSEMLSMGDYGVYVWGSYAAFVLFLSWDALAPRLRRRALLRRQALRQRREAARKTVQ